MGLEERNGRLYHYRKETGDFGDFRVLTLVVTEIQLCELAVFTRRSSAHCSHRAAAPTLRNDRTP